MNRTLTRAAWLAAALAVLSLLPACQREETPRNDGQVPDGPVSIDVTIDQDTRLSVAEADGAMSFSKGDAILISDGSNTYKGVTSSTSNSGLFVMDDGFDPANITQSTYAGFPAEFVVEIDATQGVSFLLSSTYDYSVVGGDDPEKAGAVCPMIGTYAPGGGIRLKPATSILRFYLTDVAAGSLSFMFKTDVTGETKAISESTLTAYIATGTLFKSGTTGRIITVTGVPDVPKGKNVCITLPVPAGTVPLNIVVRNDPADVSVKQRMALISGNSGALTLGHGRRFANISFIRYVDMGTVTVGGVEKNLKWATCNVGAVYPWDYGDYFAWGETEPKSSYAWSYFDTTDGGSTFIKYNNNGGKTVLDLEDDAANKNWGGSWRIPTAEEWRALENTTYYTWEFTSDYLGDGSNHAGMVVTRKNVSGTDPCAGHSILLPAAGYRDGANLFDAGSEGYYWSSSLYEDFPEGAWDVDFNSYGLLMNIYYRCYGQSVRPLLE